MKKLLPKNPLAAAGVGVLIGAGIGGFKMWSQYKQGQVTQKEAIVGAVKQGLLFGGVAAASTFAGGQGGGGVGLAAMSVLGLGVRGGGGRGGGQGGGQGGGRSSVIFDTITNVVAGLIESRVEEAEAAEVQSPGKGRKSAQGRGKGQGRKTPRPRKKAQEAMVFEDLEIDEVENEETVEEAAATPTSTPE